MKIEFRNGLLFTSIQVGYRGVTKEIANIVIDTGAAETIISPDVVEDMGLIAADEDEINSFYGIGGSMHYFFSKHVDMIRFGACSLESPKMDFGVIDPSGAINGLLGLDFLMQVKAVIDLGKLTVKFK